MNDNRNALTLIEVLVVITIIGILLGLLIPSIDSGGREPARRNQCSTLLKNLALAGIMHENSKQQFPGFVNDFGVFGSEGSLIDPSDPNADPQTLTQHRKIGTWAVAILPWLDAQPTYEVWIEDRFPVVGGGSREYPLTTGLAGEGYTPFASPNLAIMRCPSSPVGYSDRGGNSYIANVSVFNNKLVARLPGDLDGTQMSTIDPPINLADFSDGHGFTVLFSESLTALPWHRSGFSDREDLIFTDRPDEVFYPVACRYTNTLISHEDHRINGSIPGGDPFNVVMTPDNAAELARPSSAHVDGVNVSMADGGTRYIADTIDMKVWHALLTPTGREAIPDDGF